MQASKPGSFLGLGTPVLPALPLHGGDRNRTSPFAFTGNKFEFRALGLELLAGVPEHGPQHDRRRGDRRALATKLETALKTSGATLEKAVTPVVKESWEANKQIIFDGDGYSEAVAQGGRETRPAEPAHDARGAAVAGRESDRRVVQEIQGALQARARVPL